MKSRSALLAAAALPDGLAKVAYDTSIAYVAGPTRRNHIIDRLFIYDLFAHANGGNILSD